MNNWTVKKKKEDRKKYVMTSKVKHWIRKKRKIEEWTMYCSRNDKEKDIYENYWNKKENNCFVFKKKNIKKKNEVKKKEEKKPKNDKEANKKESTQNWKKIF